MKSQEQLDILYNLKSLGPTDQVYHGLIADALENGQSKEDRTQTGTRAMFGRFARFNLMNKRVPRITTKLVNENPEEEMLWFISGTPSIKALRDKSIGIWNSWLIPGSAKYRTKGSVELIELIRKHFGGNEGKVTAQVVTAEEFAKVPDGRGINVCGKSLIKIMLNADLVKSVTLYGCTEQFADTDALINYVAKEVGINTEYLIDGNIGAGAYGPQWRHWQDTQMIPSCQRQEYLDQGYKVVGKVDSHVGADFHDWDLKDKIREAFYSAHDDIASVEFVEGCDDVSEFNDNTFKYRTEKSDQVMSVYYSGEWALRELYKEMYNVPTLIVHREIDQLANAIALLKDNPDSRRIIVSAWNPALTWKAALPPCHLYFQFISHELTAEQRYAIAADRVALAKYDRSKKEQASGMTDWALVTWDDWNYARDAEHYSLAELHLKMDDAKIPRRSLNTFLLLRSNDLGLGFPFNVTQYAALTHMVAQVTGLAPGELVWAAVDAHVYENHIQPLKDMQMVRTSKPCVPRLELNKSITNIDDFKSGDLEIIDYDSHPSLAKFMPPAV